MLTLCSDLANDKSDLLAEFLASDHKHYYGTRLDEPGITRASRTRTFNFVGEDGADASDLACPEMPTHASGSVS